MKRRRFFQAIAAAPAASALLAQQQRSSNQTNEDPKLETVTPAEVGEPVLRFFSSEQFFALRRLSGLLMPALNGMPGAVECHAPEFLDFLLSESLPDRQEVYRSGLDALNAQSRKLHKLPFAEAGDSEASGLLSPLRQPWTYELPKDPLARFLVTAKADVRTATTNSREYAMSGGVGGGGRRNSGQGMYWNPLD